MENLNDVEFGSDKSKEEAPILVAQRYLNIFRQIHIFNKEKRTQFDDELLALPQNILDFFAKMPGGRLLIEHIEEVKTERGIAFIKSRKEDFIYQDASSDLQQTYGGGGNVVMDASFADTLAKSMAAAFAQSGSAAGGADPSLLATLNKTFQLIAEELKSSRASLLEIMQENRELAASAIESQKAAGLLLENLSKGVFLTPALPLPQKTPHSEETFQSQDTYNNSPRPLVNKNNNNAPIQKEGVGESINTSESQRKKKKKKYNQPNTGLPENVSNSLSTNNGAVSNSSAHNDIFIKSEKIAPAFSGVIRNITSKHEDDFKNVKLDEPPLDDISFNGGDDNIKQVMTSPQGSVSQSANNSASPESNPQVVSPLPQRSAQRITETIDSEVDDKSDFALPKSDNIPYVKEVESVDDELHDFMSDGLDFALPEQNDTPQVQENEPVNDGLHDLMSDGLDFALPEQNNTPLAHEVEPVNDGLHDLMSDGLDFALPKQNNTPQVQEVEPVANDGLDSLLGDGLDFALPEQDSTPQVQESAPVYDGLDSLLADGLDFALPEQDSTPQVQESAPVDDGLDSLLGDGLDFALPEQDSTPQVQESAPMADDGLDGLIGDVEEVSQPSPQNLDMQNNSSSLDDFSEYSQDSQAASQPEAKSRYAAELDKIREALTSDDIDISSINTPIALDDYNDDENVSETSLDDFGEFSDDSSTTQTVSTQDGSDITEGTSLSDEQTSGDEEWEWEYVDENGNPIEATDGDDEDWEWEYVEDDGSEDVSDNNTK